MANEIEKLEQENEKYREALSIIANDRETHHLYKVVDCDICPFFYEDGDKCNDAGCITYYANRILEETK